MQPSMSREELVDLARNLAVQLVGPDGMQIGTPREPRTLWSLQRL